MKKFIIVVLFFIPIELINAQGCSDAGICSIGNSFGILEKETKNNIEVGTVFGAGEADVTYISPYITYTRDINKQFSLSTKITYNVASGSFGKRGAFGDGYLIGNYKFKSKSNKKWSSLLGMKFPFTQSNLKINDYSIPLDYQSSLGTFDLLLGISLNYKKWDFNTGIQVPLINNNKNSYFKEFSGTNDFPSTNLFERKPDALVRATYTIKTTNQKFTFKPNVLFLYHLGEDSYETIFGKRESINGSDGLTINGNIISSYALNKKSNIELSLATPFLVREIRPDGLTRKFTAGINYKISF